jgi:ribosomal protein S18 acetylase RimI-like enzyme
MMIREIEHKDVPALFPVRIATRENRMSIDELASIGITADSMQAAIQGTHKGWLSEDNGKVVGFAMGDSEAAELTVIALLPEYEGKGIGKRLLYSVEQWVESKGCKSIWLTTDTDTSLRAYGFYIKHGWEDLKIEHGLRYMIKKLI